MKSLAARLLSALLIPLASIVALAVAITCWVVYSEQEVTADRVLIGSVRTLSLAYDAKPAVRSDLVPLAINLLKRRARPNAYYSVYHGGTLIGGYRQLTPPEDFRVHLRARTAEHHRPAEFSNRFAPTPLYRGYVDPVHAATVVQAAYLRDGIFQGEHARIAAEWRRVEGFKVPLVFQVASPVDDRRSWQMNTYMKVMAGGAAIFAFAALFFWWAVLWGLRPFQNLAQQVESQASGAMPGFTLELPPNSPREAAPFVDAFNALLAKTEQATASVREFTANASHQMRTPLAVLRTHLHVLRQHGGMSAHAQTALTDINAAVQTLERLLLQLIALARAEEQADTDIRETFDIIDVVATVASDCVPEALKASQEISFESEPCQSVFVTGSALLAGELVRNLLDNAIRYCPPGSRIGVFLSAGEEDVSVVVEDDGPGIPESERHRAFERFYRLSRDADRLGSGLGLPIVRALAERMHATVSLDTAANGSGLRAIVVFRRTQTAVADQPIAFTSF